MTCPFFDHNFVNIEGIVTPGRQGDAARRKNDVASSSHSGFSTTPPERDRNGQMYFVNVVISVDIFVLTDV
jgi:hypothetical protein